MLGHERRTRVTNTTCQESWSGRDTKEETKTTEAKQGQTERL